MRQRAGRIATRSRCGVPLDLRWSATRECGRARATRFAARRPRRPAPDRFRRTAARTPDRRSRVDAPVREGVGRAPRQEEHGALLDGPRLVADPLRAVSAHEHDQQVVAVVTVQRLTGPDRAHVVAGVFAPSELVDAEVLVRSASGTRAASVGERHPRRAPRSRSSTGAGAGAARRRRPASAAGARARRGAGWRASLEFLLRHSDEVGAV